MFTKAILASLPLLSMTAALAIDYSHTNITAREFLENPDILTEVVTSEKRSDIGMCNPIISKYYTLVGNGNPHQNYKITELGGSYIGCPDGSITKSYSHTTGWEIDGRIAGKVGGTAFASLTFKVVDENTETTAETFACGVDKDGICLLHYTAVTAITVDFWEHSSGAHCVAETTHTGTGVVYLPNSNAQTSGGSFIRKGSNNGKANMKQCRGGSDDRTVDFFCGPAGTSDWFVTREDGPQSDAYLSAREPKNCPIPIEAYHWD